MTDHGLAQFVQTLLLEPIEELKAARAAFLASYSSSSGKTRFTKVQMDIEADAALRKYFLHHEANIESWFNVIAPDGSALAVLHRDLAALRNKNWKEILGR